MIEIPKYRRLYMLKKLALARKLVKNAELFQGAGVYYRKDKNPKIALAAAVVFKEGVKVRVYGVRAVGVLRLWVLLRAYAWPWLRRDNSSDRHFWLVHFFPAYQVLEDKALELSQLTEPHLYEALLKKTSRWSDKRQTAV